eukprot:768778-Hanusia_phi.AAC.2
MIQTEKEREGEAVLVLTMFTGFGHVGVPSVLQTGLTIQSSISSALLSWTTAILPRRSQHLHHLHRSTWAGVHVKEYRQKSTSFRDNINKYHQQHPCKKHHLHEGVLLEPEVVVIDQRDVRWVDDKKTLNFPLHTLLEGTADAIAEHVVDILRILPGLNSTLTLSSVQTRNSSCTVSTTACVVRTDLLSAILILCHRQREGVAVQKLVLGGAVGGTSSSSVADWLRIFADGAASIRAPERVRVKRRT